MLLGPLYGIMSEGAMKVVDEKKEKGTSGDGVAYKRKNQSSLKLNLYATKAVTVCFQIKSPFSCIHQSLSPLTTSTMPKAAKRFASQRPRCSELSTNHETICIREITQSRTGFNAEEHRIKTKYRTRLARAKTRLQKSAEYIASSSLEQGHMVTECIKKFEDEKLQELEIAAKEWLDIVEQSEFSTQSKSSLKGGESADEAGESDGEVEWEGIETDNEWETEDENLDTGNQNGEDSEEDDDNRDGDGDSFEDGLVDVSDSEILYDKEGNIIEEDDVAKGLKAFMEFHLKKLNKRLEFFSTLASTKDQDDDELNE